MNPPTTISKSHRNEIVISLIGFAGIVSTAMFSNWDKLFAHQMIQVETAYTPTKNFETELRHYFDVSGARAGLEKMTEQLTEQYRRQWLTENPQDADVIDQSIKAITEEAITLDDVFRKMLPVYQKHFTLEELQELNRFYSTDIMQRMVAKMPLLAQDAAPLQMELLQDYQKRLIERLEEIE